MSKPSTSASKAPTTDEIERLLNREATAISRDVEVDRILGAYKLNPYDTLNIEPSATIDDIKKRYKQLSLLIHPDKATHPKAQDAFDLLKKAESELSDKDKRENLDATIREARNQLLKSLNLPNSTTDDHYKLKDLSPPWKEQLTTKVRSMLFDEELRRRKAIKLAMANEGREAQQKEEEVAGRKRKAEEEKTWEENREQRVDSWRSFASSGSTNKKRKKNKVEMLG